MKAEYSVLFNQESKTLLDATRWAVKLERWYCHNINGVALRRYILETGMQYNDGHGWCFSPDATVELLEGNNAAHHIRRAIQVYDELVGESDDN